MLNAKRLDMSTIPVPDSITLLDFETKLAELKAQLAQRFPSYREALEFESEPMTALLEVIAYQSLLFDARVNDAVRGTMLASAQGKDLDAIAVRYGVNRAQTESDARFRARIQQVFEGLNTAGSIQAYQFHALNADPSVKDVQVLSPKPCEITLTILSHEGVGVPSAELLARLQQYFGLTADGTEPLSTPSHVRPLGDRLTIRAAQTREFDLVADVQIAAGPSQAVLEKQLNAALRHYFTLQHGLAKPITLLGIYGALNQAGVVNAKIVAPREDILPAGNEVAVCRSMTLNIAKGE